MHLGNHCSPFLLEMTTLTRGLCIIKLIITVAQKCVQGGSVIAVKVHHNLQRHCAFKVVAFTPHLQLFFRVLTEKCRAHILALLDGFDISKIMFGQQVFDLL